MGDCSRIMAMSHQVHVKWKKAAGWRQQLRKRKPASWTSQPGSVRDAAPPALRSCASEIALRPDLAVTRQLYIRTPPCSSMQRCLPIVVSGCRSSGRPHHFGYLRKRDLQLRTFLVANGYGLGNSSGLIVMNNAIISPTTNPTIVPAATPRQNTFCSLGVISTSQRHGKPYDILCRLGGVCHCRWHYYDSSRRRLLRSCSTALTRASSAKGFRRNGHAGSVWSAS